MPFQLQKANMAALRKLSVGDRVAMARDEQFGPFLLSLMSPTDVALMFPRYYRDVLPNISGFQKAFPTSMSVAKQEAVEEQLRNTTSGSSAGANYNAGGWRKRWQENMDEQVASKSATPTKAGVRPPPQLTPGQKESFDALKQGPLAVDDPRAKMYANLTEEQLSAVGISKVKEGGKEVFKYAAPTVSDEEVKKSMSVGANESSARKSAENYLGRAMSDREWSLLLSTTKAEATSHKGETAMVMATILNRARTGWGGNTIEEVVSAKKQFSTWMNGTARQPPSEKRKQSMFESASMLSGIPHNQTEFASADPAAYNTATDGGGGVRKIQERLNRGFTRVGGQIFNAGSQSRFTSEVAPDTITTDYSQKSLELAKQGLLSRKEAERIKTLAGYTTTETSSRTGVSLDGVEQGASSGQSYGTGQCVALSRRFSNLGPAASWKFHEGESNIVPGAVIATRTYGQGPHPGGVMAKDMPDGKSHYHTGIALSYPDASGNVLVYDQWKGHGATISKRNIRDYHGETWGAVIGGEPSDKTREAVNLALSQATDHQKEIIQSAMKGQRDTLENVPTGKPAVEITNTTSKPVDQSGEILKTTPKQLSEFTGPVPPAPAVQAAPVMSAEAGQPGGAGTGPGAQPGQPGQPAQVQPTAQVQPSAPGPERYRVDTAKFINDIKQTPDFKNNSLSWLATDGMIIDGFNSDDRVKAAGVRLDSKGIMHFDKGMSKEAKQIMADFDAKSFMTKIEEKKAEVTPTPEKKPEVKPVPEKKPEVTATPEKKNIEPEKKNVVQGEPGQPAQGSQGGRGGRGANQPEVAPTKVKTNALGGSNKINTEEISAYPIGGLKGDNTVVVNKQQKPLFTMNTNESAVFNADTKTVNVTPNQKAGDVRPQKMDNPMTAAAQEFRNVVNDIKSSFDTNASPTPQPQSSVNRDMFNSDMGTGAALNNTNNLSSDWYNGSPSLRRASYRAVGVETGEPNSGFHYSQQNRS